MELFSPIFCYLKPQSVIKLLKDKEFIKLGSYSDLILITDLEINNSTKEFERMNGNTKPELPPFSLVHMDKLNGSISTLKNWGKLSKIYIYYLTNNEILSKYLNDLTIQINLRIEEGMIKRKSIEYPTFLIATANFDIQTFLTSNSTLHLPQMSKVNAFSLANKIYWIDLSSSFLGIYEAYFLNPNVLRYIMINDTNIGIISISRMNLDGCLVKAIAPEGNLTQGEISWGSRANGELYFRSGFGVDIFKALQDSLHFESIAISTDGWATQLPNGTWASGMAKEVINGNADFGLAKTSILAYRAESLAYLTPVHTLIVTAFFQQPSSASLRNIFILPFETELWLWMFVTWIILLFFQSGLGLVKEKYYPQTVHESDRETMRENLIWIISAICQHGLYKTPYSISHRIVFLLGNVFGLVVFVAYSATLMSIFTTPDIPIKTIFDLIESPLKLLVDKDSAGTRLVVADVGNSSNITHSKITKLLIEKIARSGSTRDTFISAPNGTSVIIKSGKIKAFMSFDDTFFTTFRNEHHVSDQFLCESVSSVTVTNIPFRSGLFLRKNSPYKKPFNIKIVNLYTSGLMFKYVKTYEDKYIPRCGGAGGGIGNESPALELSHVLSLILFMSFGIGFSFSLCIFECLIKQVKTGKSYLLFKTKNMENK